MVLATKSKTSLRDRTNEYRLLVTALRKRQQNSAALETSRTKALSNPAYSEFSKQAGAIGKDIQNTALLLEQLATLARNKTIFEDRTSEINGLTNQVKQQIATVNGKILALQALQRRQNGGSAAGRQATEHHSNVVVSLQSQLASTSTVFKDVLELRSESLKASGNRKEQFIGTAAAAAAAGSLDFVPAGVRNRRRNDTDSVDSPLYQMERKKSPNVYGRGAEPGANGAASNNDDFVALSLPDVDEASSSQMMLLQQQQSSYLDSRSDAISSIESTISELGQIFQQLAQMVSEQRDVVQRIDANVESIDVNIGAAQNELLRYYTNISSNRWLMAKIFLVILVFAFLLVMLV